MTEKELKEFLVAHYPKKQDHKSLVLSENPQRNKNKWKKKMGFGLGRFKRKMYSLNKMGVYLYINQ